MGLVQLSRTESYGPATLVEHRVEPERPRSARPPMRSSRPAAHFVPLPGEHVDATLASTRLGCHVEIRRHPRLCFTPSR
jgi:hypothetical protein